MIHTLIRIACVLVLAAGCRPDGGRQQTNPAAIRIISTAPALTEMVCAVGACDLLVGRTDACDYPAEIINRVPVTGKFAMPNVEQILTLTPTHLLESYLVNPVQKNALERFGIKVEHIHCTLISDIPAAIRKTGEITGHVKQAEELSLKLETDLSLIKETRSRLNTPPRALLLLDHLTPITCGTNTSISEMATLAGTKNIASSLKKEYDNISMEWIIENDPDLIICFFEIKGNPLDFFRTRSG